MHRQPVKQIPTNTVKRCNHWRNAVVNGTQVLHKLIGGYAPGANLAVDKYLDQSLGSLAAGTANVWQPLDMKSGSDDAVHTDSITAELKPLRAGEALPWRLV